MRNLVVCCDGTWNTPDDTENGLPKPTNVAKFYNALVRDETQLAYYHPGVGTGKGWWDHMLGGGTGEGLDQNTMSAYRWLANHYQKDDRIFLFGFSRGAYTVRTLGGLITRCGLLDLGTSDVEIPVQWDRVGHVFAAYRNSTPFDNKNKWPFHNVAPGVPTKETTGIFFIGVWDTVGSLGIPDDLVLLGLFDDPEHYRFHDTALSPLVKHARHAVALDEKRASFAPTLWSKVAPQTDAKQLWFPGVHGDVGGGYLETELSDTTLKWMIDEAVATGLKTRPQVCQQLKPDSLGIVHESCDGIFKFLKTKPRSAPLVQSVSRDLHASTCERFVNPPLAQGDYWKTQTVVPGQGITADVYARERWNRTGFYLEAGVTYSFIATGEWMDAQDKFSPAGAEPSGFHLGDIARFASSMLGGIETLYKNLSQRGNTDFWWTRRIETAPWFALIGFIASDVGATDSTLPEGETFLIGDKTTFMPKQSGYLYCFANDAWQTYKNNRGSVSLKVSR